VVDSFERSRSSSGEAMREVGGSEEEGQILGELGIGLESQKAGAGVSSEATVTSSETLESWIYAPFIGVRSSPGEFVFQAIRSTQVEDDKSTNSSPDPEFGKVESEPAASGACVGIDSSSNLISTSGGIPTSSS